MRNTRILPFVVAAACSHTAATPAPATPLEPERAQTPSERVTTPSDQVSGRSIETVPAGGVVTVGPRVVAVLDQTVGEKQSKQGQTFTATVVAPKQGTSALPEGTKLVGRVIKIQPAMAGSQGFIRLVIDGVQQGAEIQHIDGRIVGVELSEGTHTGGRPVNSTGAPSSEIIGSIIPEKDLPPDSDLKRDVLGRGAAISLGTGDSLHQLDKGMRLAVEVRGPILAERVNVAGPQEITQIDSLATGDAQSILGRPVELQGVPVESVIGDVVFWIGPDHAHRTLVVLDKVLDTPETAIVVKAGERVTLSGVIEKSPTVTEAPRLWKLVTPTEAQGLEGHPFYIFATKAKVVR
jgi:hypothetical protein